MEIQHNGSVKDALCVPPASKDRLRSQHKAVKVEAKVAEWDIYFVCFPAAARITKQIFELMYSLSEDIE